MWRRLSMLALCGTPMLWADVCDGLPAGPPSGRLASPLFESNKPLSFKLSVKSGGTAFRITVRPLWRLDESRRIVGDDTHAGDIEVARCQDGKRLQALPIMADQPIGFGSTFHAEDLNFDGYLDFSVETEFSAANGEVRSYWVYDPRAGIFIQNEFTHELPLWFGRQRVPTLPNTHWDTEIPRRSAELVRVRPSSTSTREKREIDRSYFDGAMTGRLSKYGRRRRANVTACVNNRLLLIHQQDFSSLRLSFLRLQSGYRCAARCFMDHGPAP